ncbi:hypothetical protein Dda_4801 [Drechslerella dactyloides]|uniref:Uncharacterized protein n=1 Tax=Drechslerella dactyloides TaxID=74499 RepID=A0AAD6NJQ0_DREDA|nr:hypothetical protein Dda_4801 [Drechslerella dactyloides]
MAYRVPQHRQTAQPTTPQQQIRDRPSLPTTSALGQSATADSEEWVVFSPTTDAQTVRTPTSGRASRISDLASLQYDDDDDELEAEEEDVLGDDEEEDEDEDYDEDIDLHGFRDLYHQGPVMLPQHDGLGTFPSAASLQGVPVEKVEQEAPVLASRNSFTNARIQAWRMEQSRILLDEIERATKGRLGLRETEAQRREEELATMSDVGLQEMNERALADRTADHETFWERLRRRLVQDIMGLDDMVLQIIFGEALPADFETSSGASTPTGRTEGGLKRMDASWEERLFERLARELGVLAQYYTPDVAKAAFSTYVTGKSQTSSTTATIPAAAATTSPTGRARSTGARTPTYSLYPSLQSSTSYTTLDPLSSTRQFRPTIDGEDDQDSHAANWGIEDGPLSSSLLTASSEARVDAEIVREYWEKELNVRMLFSYLKSKLAAAPPQSPAASTSTTAAPTAAAAPPSRHHRSSSSPTNTASSSSAAAGRTANAYRYSTLNQPLHQQHPLISHAQKANVKSRRISPIASLTSVLGVGMGGFRSGSSCASQSTTTRKSAGQKQKEAEAKSNSSKHFWDVGSTVGSSRSSCVGGPVWADV